MFVQPKIQPAVSASADTVSKHLRDQNSLWTRLTVNTDFNEGVKLKDDLYISGSGLRRLEGTGLAAHLVRVSPAETSVLLSDKAIGEQLVSLGSRVAMGEKLETTPFYRPGFFLGHII